MYFPGELNIQNIKMLIQQYSIHYQCPNNHKKDLSCERIQCVIENLKNKSHISSRFTFLYVMYLQINNS